MSEFPALSGTLTLEGLLAALFLVTPSATLLFFVCLFSDHYQSDFNFENLNQQCLCARDLFSLLVLLAQISVVSEGRSRGRALVVQHCSPLFGDATWL